MTVVTPDNKLAVQAEQVIRHAIGLAGLLICLFEKEARNLSQHNMSIDATITAEKQSLVSLYEQDIALLKEINGPSLAPHSFVQLKGVNETLLISAKNNTTVVRNAIMSNKATLTKLAYSGTHAACLSPQEGHC